MINTQLATQGLPLNASQLEAAQAAINTNVLIHAAAGTGKTSTMIARVAHFLSQVWPEGAAASIRFQP